MVKDLSSVCCATAGPGSVWATGCAFATISAGALALSRLSRFLAEGDCEVVDETGLTRPVLEDYMAWLLTQGYSPSTRVLSLSMIRVFFDACHRHGWLPQLGAGATIYVEEVLSTTNRSPGSSPSSSWPNSSPTRR